MTVQKWRERRLARQTSEFAVIGLGRLGSSLARRLEARKHPVLGIDTDQRVVQDLADELTEVVILDATVEEALLEVDIASFDTVIVAIASDLAASALIVDSLKRLGIRRVICQAATDRHGEILRRVGADRIVRPYHDSGLRLADELSGRDYLEHMTVAPGFSLVRLDVSRSLAGRPTAVCEEAGLTVLFIRRGGQLILSPESTESLAAGDSVYVVGPDNALDTFSGKL